MSSEARSFLESLSFRFAMEIFVSVFKRHQLSPWVWFRGWTESWFKGFFCRL